jgi:hypothetical protein
MTHKIAAYLVFVLATADAVAHPSTLPHDHPHGVTLLPDLMVLVVAAVAIGAALVLVRTFKRGAFKRSGHDPR